MAKKPVLPLARLAEAKVIKGKGKTKGKGQFPLWAKAKAKAKAMAKQKAKARDYSLASPSSHDKDSVAHEASTHLRHALPKHTASTTSELFRHHFSRPCWRAILSHGSSAACGGGGFGYVLTVNLASYADPEHPEVRFDR